MSSTAATGTSLARNPHRISRAIHVARCWSYAYAFVVVALLAAERGYGTGMLAAAVLQFLVYPHVLWWRLRRAEEPRRVDSQHMLLDALLLGAWNAQLEFTVWIAYGTFTAVAANNIINRGPRAFAMAVALFGGGAALWGATRGYAFRPEASALIEWLCFAGAFAYVCLVGLAVYRNSRRLVEAREALRLSLDEVRRNEEKLLVAGHAFENLGEALMIWSADGTIVQVNKAYTRLTGYAPEDVIGRPEAEFRSPLQPAGFHAEVQRTLQQDGRWSGGSWAKRKDGSLYREYRNISVVRDDRGSISHYVALFFETAQPSIAGRIARA
ncbi:MAG: PAS domain-containing protein [Burkholderiales bacterium]